MTRRLRPIVSTFFIHVMENVDTIAGPSPLHRCRSPRRSSRSRARLTRRRSARLRARPRRLRGPRGIRRGLPASLGLRRRGARRLCGSARGGRSLRARFPLRAPPSRPRVRQVSEHSPLVRHGR
jgi:hypothetical protein